MDSIVFREQEKFKDKVIVVGEYLNKKSIRELSSQGDEDVINLWDC